QWAAGRGFEVAAGGVALAIQSVQIVQPDQVVIQLTQPPPAGGLMVSYAMIQDVAGFTGGTADGRQGQLRDGDDTAGYDLETIPCAVTAGSATVTAMGKADF